VTRAGDAAHFFTDDDFVWVEPALETAPTMPTTLPAPMRRRRHGQTRTFAGDLSRLKAELAAQAESLPPRVRALVAAGVLASLLALALVVTIRPTGHSEEGVPPKVLPKSGSLRKQVAQDTSLSFKTLRAGDRTAAVADLQQALGALGLYSQPVDGDFGDSTATAVLAFQSAHGLVADGVAGPTTLQALVETLSADAKSDAAVAQDGLVAAVTAGRMSNASADRYRSLLNASLERLRAAPPGRVPTLALVFHDVASFTAEYDEPRALTLFSMLKENADYLVKRAPPAQFTDTRAPDGVVYRFINDHGFQFHPIANFARLNKLAAKGRRNDVKHLAAALVARGIPSRKGLLWEYYFPFGGPTRWTSGFAQAIGAQALARSSALLHDAKLADAARAAYRGISRGLWLERDGGLWIREYGYSDMAVLNAQLQSLVSLYDYAKTNGDSLARADVEKMASVTRTLLPQLDTGCWSRYSLGGSPASLHYHTYHVSLLNQLAARTGDPLWSTTAARWNGYLRSGGPTSC
jgi:D-glucuronyl C5-epimerase-like protein/putative peptidoglycan binding protein